MNILSLFRNTVVVLLTCASMASCMQDDMNSGGNPLPPGKYPLLLTASIDGMTSGRSAAKDAWAKGDTIGVRIGDGEMGLYALNPDGTIQDMVHALHWQNTVPANVKAWFPHDDRTDVSLADQSQGFYDKDYLYAEVPNQMYYSQVPLKFKHSMAKVQCNIIQGTDITDEEFKTLVFNFWGFTKASWVDGVLTGKDYGKITSTSDHQALVVPQDMTGKELFHISITVSINGKVVTREFSYKSTEGELQSGTRYIYNITVKKDRIDVNYLIGKWDDVDPTPYPAKGALFKVNLPQNMPGIDRKTLEFENVENVDRYRNGEDDFLLLRGQVLKMYVPANDIERSREFIMIGNRDEDQRTSAPSSIEELEKPVHEYSFFVRSEEVSLDFVDIDPRLGYILFEDGSWFYRPVEGKTPVGVIFYLGKGLQDDIADVNEDWKDRIVKGYAVSITDAGNYKWGPIGSTVVEHPKYPSASYNLTIRFGYLDVSTSSAIWFRGYSYTHNVMNSKYFKGDYGTFSGSEKIQYENPRPDKYAGTMFTGLQDYSESVPVHSISSDWYIPSIKQLSEIETNLDIVNSSLKKIEGADLVEPYSTSSKTYWTINSGSNVTSNCDNASYYQMKVTPRPSASGSKDIERTLRPILTF
ncbi:MAG: fimbrillin family protein [Muribaculaceae bacterium]|nr:fimbrillin family protein [Muribaculaceae bacterium]